MNKERISVVSKDAAWALANRLFPTDYDKDEVASTNAGYPVYRHNTLNPENRICDLGCRLEVNLGSDTINIWIENPEAEELEKQVEALTKKCEERYTELTEAHREKRAALDAIDELNAEIVNLKAKLYDLIVGGKN